MHPNTHRLKHSFLFNWRMFCGLSIAKIENESEIKEMSREMEKKYGQLLLSMQQKY